MWRIPAATRNIEIVTLCLAFLDRNTGHMWTTEGAAPLGAEFLFSQSFLPVLCEKLFELHLELST